MWRARENDSDGISVLLLGLSGVKTSGAAFCSPRPRTSRTKKESGPLNTVSCLRERIVVLRDNRKPCCCRRERQINAGKAAEKHCEGVPLSESWRAQLSVSLREALTTFSALSAYSRCPCVFQGTPDEPLRAALPTVSLPHHYSFLATLSNPPLSWTPCVTLSSHALSWGRLESSCTDYNSVGQRASRAWTKQSTSAR